MDFYSTYIDFNTVYSRSISLILLQKDLFIVFDTISQIHMKGFYGSLIIL